MSKLLAIVEVEEEHKVQCQEPGCGHGVYKRIHVVEVDGGIMVMGSTCFEKRFGSAPALPSEFSGGGVGRKLTELERAILLENTAELIARFGVEAEENESRRLEELERARKAYADRKEKLDLAMMSMRSQRLVGKPWVNVSIPWQWVRAMSSMGYFHLSDDQGWVRVMHTNGSHYVMPWPTFDGWDECLPPVVGNPDLNLGGYKVGAVSDCVGYLRKHAEWEKIGIWREITESIEKNKS